MTDRRRRPMAGSCENKINLRHCQLIKINKLCSMDFIEKSVKRD
jgi:hypothetical protein